MPRSWNANEHRALACYYCLLPVEVGEGHCWGGKSTKPGFVKGTTETLPKKQRRRSFVAHKVCLVHRWTAGAKAKAWLAGDDDFIAKLEGRTPEVSEYDRLLAETTLPMGVVEANMGTEEPGEEDVCPF